MSVLSSTITAFPVAIDGWRVAAIFPCVAGSTAEPNYSQYRLQEFVAVCVIPDGFRLYRVRSGSTEAFNEFQSFPAALRAARKNLGWG